MNGTDIEMGSTLFTTDLLPAVQEGLATPAQVRAAARRSMKQLFIAGRFDPVGSSDWHQLGLETINSTLHQQIQFVWPSQPQKEASVVSWTHPFFFFSFSFIISFLFCLLSLFPCTFRFREKRWDASLQGLVLLKNDNNILPLKRGQRIAVLGPMGETRAGLLEDYAGDQQCWNGYDCIATIAEAITAINTPGFTNDTTGVDIDSTSTADLPHALDLAR